MFRFRRYRVYLIFSIISILAIIHFSGFGEWSSSSFTPSVPALKPESRPQAPAQEQKPKPKPVPQPVPPTLKNEQDPEVPAPEKGAAAKPTTPVVNGGKGLPTPTKPEAPVPPVDVPDNEVPMMGGQGRQDVDGSDKTGERWEKQPERFPVASTKVIPLPTGAAKKLPKIQFEFAAESAASKVAREEKLVQIKSSLKRSWDGYRKHAWTHDEVRPESGGYRDPFMGWGATLVDSLDTLWIAGMREEFEEAVRAVGNLDFKTSKRKDIPLFETVIRYLGGLIGAYDISDGQYRTLLDKAIELAEILMGAFDTPNRMPVTYYMWAPAYASQPHRAGHRVVLAEIGSLSIEFTRLAQITQNNRYYDAIARITNALEKWQPDTSIPGLWPSFIDASGCKKVKKKPIVQNPDSLRDSPDNSGAPSHANPHGKRDETELQGRPLLPGEEPANYEKRPSVPDLSTAPPWKVNMPSKPTQNQDPDFDDEEHCEDQGLTYPPGVLSATYTVGSLADSAYEYLPKTYALLGGLNDQYKSMYQQSRDAIMKHIAFRPMLPDSKDILFVSEATTTLMEGDTRPFRYKYRGSHLGCFVGGMFGVGSRLFGLTQDLDIAAKMADACVWAYNSTASHIMPEEFTVLPCDDVKGCEWNQTAYLDDIYKNNQAGIDSLMVRKNSEEAVVRNPTATYTAGRPMLPTPLYPNKQDMAPVQKTQSPTVGLAKRMAPDETAIPDPIVADPTKAVPGGAPVATSTAASHAQLAEMYIKDSQIPPGMTRINSAKYILRPEAIESVFLMYRITGDETWREKGWEMFNAIERATRTNFGNSAIADVNGEATIFEDEMESFWIGETLKYFYLLFSDPDVVSLDEYVLNTEAHPHKRPLAR
ncbi:mannosyl-oligosaccharide 1,2-alpha-mannosidase IC [Arthroderma uncinatum]|uniref:mannosyl-oligosaccharide 1,2-alpha-mannosidase IC n=1 Tax=Arthroderma uncinatum TaxID=74035 RepID=UPI00144A7F2E|nr:mannosyl-oligosaccharide 1,2-alpha-mannosidase IC [Arthroderma uncinatum]KAF3490509.1 mannosyl-oligosaccharide 1,2-alpha-mannosidase IC [Arthroderma uncinatum]